VKGLSPHHVRESRELKETDRNREGLTQPKGNYGKGIDSLVKQVIQHQTVNDRTNSEE
jgi:hypothetical protein